MGNTQIYGNDEKGEYFDNFQGYEIFILFLLIIFHEKKT